MIAERIPALKTLSAEEKLALASELWDEVAEHPELLPIREDHVKILQERMQEFERNPHDTVPWEAVKKRLRSSR